MDEHTPNPKAETAAESAGVGSPAGVDAAASESPSMDPQAELQDLDASLSEMTNLLLSGEDDDPFDVEGVFADADGVVAETPPDTPPDLQPDPVAEIDQVQAAVEAALEAAAGDLGDAPERDDTTDAEASGGDTAIGDAPGTDVPGDQLVASESEAQELEDRFGDPDPEADEPDMTEPGGPAGESGAEPIVDPNAVMEVVSEALESQFADPESPDAEGEPRDLTQEAQAPEAETEAGSQADPAAAVDPTPATDPEERREMAPAAIAAAVRPRAAPRAAAAVDPEASQTAAPKGAAPRKAATNKAQKTDLKTRVRTIARPMGRAVAAKAGDLLARGVEPVAASLAGQPKVMRHSLAWLALATAFNAGVIWSYLAFFRSTGHEVDPAAMTQISGSEAAPGAAGEGTPGGPGSPPPAGSIDPAAAVMINPVGR